MAVGLVKPALGVSGAVHVRRTPYGGPGGLVRTVSTRPWTVVRDLGSGGRLWYAFQLVASFGALPLLAPAVLAPPHPGRRPSLVLLSVHDAPDPPRAHLRVPNPFRARWWHLFEQEGRRLPQADTVEYVLLPKDPAYYAEPVFGEAYASLDRDFVTRFDAPTVLLLQRRH